VCGRPGLEKEDNVEEIFDQLWSIPNERPRVPEGCNNGHLMWIRRDLVEAGMIHPEDCFPIGRF
jgi:hypothetical protein